MPEYATMFPTELNRCELFFTSNVSGDRPANVLMDTLVESFTVNVLGVHWVTRAFLPLLQKGTLKKVAHM
jgi:hypothetical protein